MRSDLFILLFGHGRSGTSAVMGFLNLSPDINMAFEENIMILQDDNPKVWAGAPDFSFDHDLAQRFVPDIYNGNKIILGPYFISAERFIECVERRTLIVNHVFSKLKVLFIDRDKTDLINSIRDRKGADTPIEWAIENWEQNEKELVKLKEHFSTNFTFDFYEFLMNTRVRREMFNFLDLDFNDEWNDMIVDSVAYGRQKLSLNNVRHLSAKTFVATYEPNLDKIKLDPKFGLESESKVSMPKVKTKTRIKTKAKTKTKTEKKVKKSEE